MKEKEKLVEETKRKERKMLKRGGKMKLFWGKNSKNLKLGYTNFKTTPKQIIL